MAVSKPKINVDDNVEIRETKCGQKGIFAKRDFAVGEVLGDDISLPGGGTEAGWATMSLEKAKCLPPEQRKIFLKYSFSIDFDGTMFGPLNSESVDTTSYINHSCDPNVWYSETGDSFVARYPIKAGEEITMDYAMCSVNIERNFWDCFCGSPNCRGRHHADDWKKLIKIYGLHFPPYLRPKIQAMMQEMNTDS